MKTQSADRTRKKRVLFTRGAELLLAEAGVLEKYIERSGAEILRAETGLDVLTRVNELPSPDVVILEIRLAGINAPDITRHVRADPASWTTPVILVAKEGEEHLERFCSDTGATAFLKPPYKFDELLESTAQALDISVRRDKRVDVRMKVDYEHFEKGFVGESIDLSLSGILVSVRDCDLEVGYPVVLEFKPSGLDLGITSRGAVRRIMHRAEEKGYEVGIEFVDMSPRSKAHLEMFLDAG